MRRAVRQCAVGVALSFALVHPASAVSKPMVVRGKLKEVIVDYRDGRSATRYLVASGRHVTKVRPVGAVRADNGDAVRVRGHWRDGSLKGRISRVRSATASAAAGPTRAEEGIRKLAVLLVSLPGHPAEASPKEVQEAVFTDSNSVNAFYRFESFGEIGFRGIQNPEGDVFGPYELAGTTTECPTEAQLKEAMVAAEAEGAPIYQYQNIVGAFPRANCWFSGLAIGGRSLLSGFITHPVLYAHELGHNLGLGHARSLECVDASGEPVAIAVGSGECTTREYGDPFDAMGGWPIWATRNNDLYLKYLGVLTDANIETVMSPGAYTMRASLSDPSQVKFLRVPAGFNAKKEPSLWYYLELRAAGSPFEPGEIVTAQQGVSIRRADIYGGGTSLIDTNPQTFTATDAPLAPGRSFSDGNVTIETLSVANDEATVAITTPDWIDPSAPADLKGVAVPQGLQLSWSPATDNIGVAGYWIYRDNTSLGHVPGATTSFLDSTGNYGPHTYSVVAEDAARNYSPETKAHFTFPDIVAPSAPANVQATLVASGVKLGWQASSDNAGAPKYTVLRGSTKLGETAERSFLDPDLSPGTREYTVYAKDSAGNASAPATPVFLTIAEAPVATVNPTPIAPLDEEKKPTISLKRVPLGKGWTLFVIRVLNPPDVQSLELVVDGKRVASGDAALLKARWKQTPRSQARHRAVVRLLTPDGRTYTRTFRFG
jgi:hypothetical protein